MSEYYVEVKKENIKFAGKTEEEKKLNEMIYDLTLENDALYEENKDLKEKLNIAETNYDIIYGYFTQINELLGTELCEEVLDEILKLKKNNNILNEFEKWLNKSIAKSYNKVYALETKKPSDCAEYLIFTEILEKLKELEWLR